MTNSTCYRCGIKLDESEIDYCYNCDNQICEWSQSCDDNENSTKCESGCGHVKMEMPNGIGLDEIVDQGLHNCPVCKKEIIW